MQESDVPNEPLVAEGGPVAPSPVAAKRSTVLVIASVPRSLANFRGHLICAMVAKGHDVHVAAPGWQEASTTHLLLESWGAQVHPITMKRAGLNPVFDIATFLSIFRLLRAIRPTHLLAYTAKPVVYGLTAGRLAGVQNRFALITGLGYAFSSPRGIRGAIGRVVRALYRQALIGARVVFFQNPDDQHDFQSLGLVARNTRSVVVKGSGVDVDAFTAAPYPAQMTFLMIARLVAAKGVREYAIAAKTVKERHPEARFLLVGSIDSVPDAIRQTELDTWVAEGAIEYLGRLDDVRPAIASASVYVLPSYREGTPRSVLEAMAMARPVITTDAPGCRETVISGFNGFTVPVRSPEGIAAAMEQFVEIPSLVATLGGRSREIAVEKYDVHKVNAVMLENMNI